jgi:hypothetical protein
MAKAIVGATPVGYEEFNVLLERSFFNPAPVEHTHNLPPAVTSSSLKLSDEELKRASRDQRDNLRIATGIGPPAAYAPTATSGGRDGSMASKEKFVKGPMARSDADPLLLRLGRRGQFRAPEYTGGRGPGSP